MTDKRMTEDDVVAELRDGMTIGIGGWGSRRKPMALVRAHRRAPTSRTSRSSRYGGPDVGLLCATGKVKQGRLRVRVARLDPLEPHFRNARQAGAVQTLELDEGMFLLGLQAAAWRVPFLPTRVGPRLRRRRRVNPRSRTVASPYDDGEELVAVPALDARRRARAHAPRRRTAATASTSASTRTSTTSFCMAAPTAVHVASSRSSPPRTSLSERPACRRCASTG